MKTDLNDKSLSRETKVSMHTTPIKGFTAVQGIWRFRPGCLNWNDKQERCGHPGSSKRVHLHRLLQRQLRLLRGQLCSHFWSNRQVTDLERHNDYECFSSRWVVFALSPELELFDEAILSYQCVCRQDPRSNSFDTRLGWKSRRRQLLWKVT